MYTPVPANLHLFSKTWVTFRKNKSLCAKIGLFSHSMGPKFKCNRTSKDKCTTLFAKIRHFFARIGLFPHMQIYVHTVVVPDIHK